MAQMISAEFDTVTKLNREYAALRAAIAEDLGLTRFRVSSDAIQLLITFNEGQTWARHSTGLDAARDVVRLYSKAGAPHRFKLRIDY